MKILFFGDSLTRGQVGASYVQRLAEKYPDSQLVNGGTNGDTVNVIGAKLLRHLAHTNDYDCLVLQGGGNDILLPTFQDRGGLFAFAYRSQLQKGMVPLPNPAAYHAALRQLFQDVKARYRGPIVFITMTCLNEHLATPLNRQRAAYNQAARSAAAAEGIRLADAEPLFEDYLAGKPQTSYLIESFWAVTFTDRLLSLRDAGTMLLSKRRKLHLTIDGAHLNAVGASLISECVSRTIEQPVATAR